VIGLAGLDRLDPLAASSGGLGELLRASSKSRASGSAWAAARRSTAARLAGAAPATDDGVLRRAHRSGRRRAHLRASEGGAAEDVAVLAERLAGLGLPRGPHTGAAGGLGAKLLALGASWSMAAIACSTSSTSPAACRGVEAVVTGEGRLDASSLEGKLPVVVAARARALGLRVVAASAVAATAGSARRALRRRELRSRRLAAPRAKRRGVAAIC
jgi:glycerate kinase